MRVMKEREAVRKRKGEKGSEEDDYFNKFLPTMPSVVLENRLIRMFKAYYLSPFFLCLLLTASPSFLYILLLTTSPSFLSIHFLTTYLPPSSVILSTSLPPSSSSLLISPLLSSSYYLSPFFHSFLLTASLPPFSQSGRRERGSKKRRARGR
jgi:hypothetical protein